MNVETATPEGYPAEDPGESVYVETNGVRLHTVQTGPEDGPLVVLLHGFPEFWYGWHDLLRPLSNAGYRVVVPDQRGYNLSDKPDGVDAYHLDELAADVVGLVDALGAESAYLVGHDWGAAVAWWVALHHPDRVEKLCVVNVPHPHVFDRTMRRHWDQRFRSWYVLFFQLPVVPELVSRVHGWQPLVRTMRRTSLPGTFTVADFERYREAWNRPGAFRAMLNWYRAIVRSRPRPRRTRVTVPTLVVWGERDRFLRKSMARESVDLCDDGRLLRCEDATHWVHHEESVRVAEALLEFFAE
ncbi:Pimeloyl-ACP methyl ester carboxylesterase [Halogranum amylolyticum]|uniref:Pimeloyl-ACP methyl ester carboxylesterase n=1 Tax=Halogranum amylolyticum TaxID=660520 RepID=A0A1H8RM48_9EURY|nr:alpha/beta hydrolase [Halogranum amylolyticum]SEO67347.1 Pimeloyl-ACP methyl ester carboxylesterase [Halogranum amylolyticum]